MAELFYFPHEARSLTGILAYEYCGLPYKFTPVSSDWSALKPTCPFGQLPILKDEGRVIAQSGAILRYIARKGKIEGTSDKDFALSEQLMQEAEDIFVTFTKAKNSGDAAKDKFTKAFTEFLPHHLAYLGRFLTGDKFTTEVTVGELTLFANLKQIVNLQPNVLKGYKVEAFYNRIAALPAIAGFLARSELRPYIHLPEGYTAPETVPEPLPALEPLVTPSSTVQLVYFPVSSKATISMLTAELAGVPFEFHNVNWPADKEKTPFGQVPVLVHNDVYIAQSTAIARYIARKGGLLNLNDADYGISEMLLQEGDDLFSGLAKAKYEMGSKKENYEETAVSHFKPQLPFLDNLLQGEDRFTSTGLTLGEIALFHLLDLWTGVVPDVLKGHKIEKFYQRLANDERVKAFKAKHAASLNPWFAHE
jgi:glutathione S-transferase